MSERSDLPNDRRRSANAEGSEFTNSGAISRLRRAIETATRSPTNRAELEEAARELVAELRSAQHPPEQMLLQIKQLLAEAGLRPSYAVPSEPGLPTGIEASIYRDVIAWSIRHYYDDGQRNRPNDTDT